MDKRFPKRIAEADATLLITDKAAVDCPASVRKLANLDKTVYVWNPCGINCILLGGSIHSRQAAMQLHAILEENNYYPYMANVLPRQCSWHNVYRVDPSMETAGPCVLWDSESGYTNGYFRTQNVIGLHWKKLQTSITQKKQPLI